MRSNYRQLGQYIRQVDVRNKDLSIQNLLGVSIEKKFIPSIANIVGTNLRGYKIVRTGQFAYGPVTSRNGDKISIAYLDSDDCIISSSYTVFEVINKDKIDCEYLMLWFSRPEFDRYARYKSHGSVREIFDWDELCAVELPVPDIEKQRKIVTTYKIINDRIELKRRINDNLEKMAQAVYFDTVSQIPLERNDSIYTVLSVINGSPFASEYFNSDKRGFPLVRIRDLSKCSPDIYTDEMINKMEFVNAGDILIGMDGEFIPHIWYGLKGLLNQRVCKVIPKNEFVHPLFLYLTLKPILAEVQRTQGGTTVIHIGKKDFDRMTCVALSTKEHHSFSKKVSPIFSKMLENYKEIHYLSQTENTIMSLLSR